MRISINFSIIWNWFLFFLSASSAVEQLDQGNPSVQRENGYDCGNVFFTDRMVSDALSIALSKKGERYMRPYVGPLYDVNRNYLTWPIIQDGSSFGIKKISPSLLWRNSIHQVVFANNGQVVIDVIVRTSNNDFTKCWRVDRSQPTISKQGIEEAQGYYCGSRFIPNADLEKSASYALKYLGEDEKQYPKPYKGHLYGEELGLLVWPIYMGNSLCQNSNHKGSPYLVVLDPTGQVKDVIVRTRGDGHIKCYMSNNVPPAYASNASENNVCAKQSRSGFDCNGTFFDDNELQLASEMARQSWYTGKNSVFPVEYTGFPCDSSCLLWPIKPSGSTIITGKLSPFRLVLTNDFGIICVVMGSSKAMNKCKRRMIIGGSLKQDQNHFRCDNTLFYHNELVSVAKTACKKRNLFNRLFPQRYEGVMFEVPGPYLIYPIMKGKMYYAKPGLNYMVMNYDCIVAGALKMDKTTKRLEKCDVWKPADTKDSSI